MLHIYIYIHSPAFSKSVNHSLIKPVDLLWYTKMTKMMMMMMMMIMKMKKFHSVSTDGNTGKLAVNLLLTEENSQTWFVCSLMT